MREAAGVRGPLRLSLLLEIWSLTLRSSFFNRRVLAGVAFSALAVAACVVVGRRLTHSSWPLAHAKALLVALAVTCYFVSSRRARARLASTVSAGASTRPKPAASRRLVPPPRAVQCCPFRLDYLVKIGTLRKLSGIRIGLEAIALSIISLGMLDAVAMLPLSISATATSTASFRGPLLIVVAFGLGCCALLAASASQSCACRYSDAAAA